ncbi:MAG TPA: roadblock/LC7 domain-containing protein [Actinomycetes bacterium]|nr:roadblock/LC7 domain-containing protein [Actinomycetes bacterium]
MSDPYAGATAGAINRAAQLDQVLATLLRQAPDLEAAAVVSFDGLPMASALPQGMDEDRVAAMSAALLSLGERAAQGLGRGDLSQVYVEGDNGTVFLVSADDEAVLVAVGRHGAKVGLMLFEVKQAAEAVATCLRIEVEDVPPPLAAVETVPVEPQIDESQPVEPLPVEPVAVEAAPVEPAPVQPVPVQAVPVEPVPVELVPVEPVRMAPVPAEPAPVQPAPVENVPVEPLQAVPAPAVVQPVASDAEPAFAETAAPASGWNGRHAREPRPANDSGTWA